MKVTLGNYRKNGSGRTEKIQIDKWDSWSADHTLALIAAPLLKQLRDTTHGYPGEKGMTMAKWKKILDKMIWSFEQITDDDNESQFYSGEIDWIETPLPNGDVRCTKGPNDTFKVDMKGMAKHNKKIQDGLDLFGKYFRSLWD